MLLLERRSSARCHRSSRPIPSKRQPVVSDGVSGVYEYVEIRSGVNCRWSSTGSRCQSLYSGKNSSRVAMQPSALHASRGIEGGLAKTVRLFIHTVILIAELRFILKFCCEFYVGIIDIRLGLSFLCKSFHLQHDLFSYANSSKGARLSLLRHAFLKENPRFSIGSKPN